MAKIFTLCAFKQGKFCAEAETVYEIPDDTVGYFKMTGWARDTEDGDPPVAAVITHDDLNPHAPAPPQDDVVIQPDNVTIGITSNDEV